MTDSWRGRKNKSRQDEMPANKRERMIEWDRRLNWMREHKPRRSADWNAYKARNSS